MNNDILVKSAEELKPFIKEMTQNGKVVKIKVNGNSMFPLFSSLRDSVCIKKSSDYKKYDIILYVRDNGALVLHRIVKKKNGVYTLCGDNQLVTEYPIYENQIIGKVTEFERKGKVYSFKNPVNQLYHKIWCLNIKLRKPLLILLLKIARLRSKLINHFGRK